MKITKHVHSCLLIEDSIATLVDPGVFSWQSGNFDISKINRIDQIVITHNHGDHLHPEFIKVVLTKFPKVSIVGNNSIKEALNSVGISVEVKNNSKSVTPFNAPHEKLPFPDAVAPPNNGYHIGEITHPGDSHTFNETKKVLALPVIAPWGKTGDAVIIALKLQPKHIIPIHDWHYSDKGREWLYGRLKETFSKENIRFHPLGVGETTEIN